jgi:hypothetical protein
MTNPPIEPPASSPVIDGLADYLSNSGAPGDVAKGIFTKDWWLFFHSLTKRLAAVVSGEAEIGQVTFGLESDLPNQGPSLDGTNAVNKYATVLVPGSPYVGAIACVGLPATTLKLDALYSRDNAVTWTSLFPPGGASFLATGKHGLLLSVFADVSLQVGDLMRIDILLGGGALGITLEIRWKPAV